jgi:hypothetical protein
MTGEAGLRDGVQHRQEHPHLGDHRQFEARRRQSVQLLQAQHEQVSAGLRQSIAQPADRGGAGIDRGAPQARISGIRGHGGGVKTDQQTPFQRLLDRYPSDQPAARRQASGQGADPVVQVR